MNLVTTITGDFAARARREELAAERSASREARLAHEKLARLCRERATTLRWFEGGLAAVAE